MKPLRWYHLIGAGIAVVVLFLIGAYFALINYILTGEAFPND